MSEELRVDIVKNTITMTKEFNKKAQVFNSPEYVELFEAMEACMKFNSNKKPNIKTGIAKKAGKQSYKGLNMNYIERYTQKKGTAEQIKKLRILMARDIDIVQPKPFAEIKKWFLIEFPEFVAFMEAQREIIEETNDKKVDYVLPELNDAGETKESAEVIAFQTATSDDVA